MLKCLFKPGPDKYSGTFHNCHTEMSCRKIRAWRSTIPQYTNRYDLPPYHNIQTHGRPVTVSQYTDISYDLSPYHNIQTQGRPVTVSQYTDTGTTCYRITIYKHRATCYRSTIYRHRADLSLFYE